MSKQFYFLSGLPRTGSTVLGSILSQNPDIYVSGTSRLVNLIIDIDNRWAHYFEHLTNNPLEQKYNTYKGLFNGCYKHIKKPIILDKNRIAQSNIELMTKILGDKPKFITTVRDVPEIIASWVLLEKAINPGPITKYVTQHSILNNENLCYQIWKDGLSIQWENFQKGFKEYKECFYIIEYNDLINKPKETINGIYDFLNVKPFKHNFNNIINPEPENDEKVYGHKGLHDIKPKLKRYSPAAIKVLGKEMFNYYTDKKLEFWK